jgi:hypothetical protein
MDINRLTLGEKIAAGAGILLLIFMFLSWFGYDTGASEIAEQFGVDTGDDTIGFNAWESFDFIDLVLALTAIAAIALAAMKASANRVELPVSAATVVAALGGLATLLILFRIISPPSDADREFGVFLGLLAAAAIAYGGYRAMQEEGTTFQDAADRLSDRSGGGGGGTGTGAGSTGGASRPGAGAPPPPPPPPPPSTGA